MDMLWGMEDLRCVVFGMQDLNSKKQGEKVVWGIGQPPPFIVVIKSKVDRLYFDLAHKVGSGCT